MFALGQKTNEQFVAQIKINCFTINFEEYVQCLNCMGEKVLKNREKLGPMLND